MMSNIMYVHYIGHNVVTPKQDKKQKQPPNCAGCKAPLKSISYTIWGTKRFDPKTNSYIEDESMGNTDMEFTCPNCSTKVDPEGIIF